MGSGQLSRLDPPGKVYRALIPPSLLDTNPLHDQQEVPRTLLPLGCDNQQPTILYHSPARTINVPVLEHRLQLYLAIEHCRRTIPLDVHNEQHPGTARDNDRRMVAETEIPEEEPDDIQYAVRAENTRCRGSKNVKSGNTSSQNWAR